MLPKENRLTAKADFEFVRQNGKFKSTPILTISYAKRPAHSEDAVLAGRARFGFIVSKKISMKAHIRNRVKRKLREIVRKNLPKVKMGTDYVILAKPGIVRATNDTIENILRTFFKEREVKN